ncbi:MAG: alpha/beta hydrolase fold domain-containing protein [Lautropia sp.]
MPAGWPDQMALPTPEMARVRARCSEIAAGLPDRYAVPIEQARTQLLQERAWWQLEAPAMASIEHAAMTVDGRPVGLDRFVAHGATAPGCGGPDGVPDDVVIVYLHGGGWCVGSNATHESILRRLAHHSRRAVVGVDYSLAPEHPFPAAQDDVGAAIEYILARWPTSGGFVLAGDSAGANLALVEALRRRDTQRQMPRALMLFYGVYGRVRPAPSMSRFGDGAFGLSQAALSRYQSLYLGLAPGEEPPRPCQAFPLEADLRGLPTCMLVAAELDPLADDSRELERRLREAAVCCDLHVFAGLTHGFLSYGRMLPAVDEALVKASTVLAS